MSGNQKLVVFNLTIIFPIFVLTIIFPIFVLAAPRDGSSPDLVGLPDLPSFDVKGRAADISIFMDDIDDIEVEEDDNSRGDVIVEPNNSGLIGQDPNAPRDPLLHVDICDTLRHLIFRESLRNCPKPKPQVCDPHEVYSRLDGMINHWPDCQCISPAQFSRDGFGNCNVGSAKDDQRPWCYISVQGGFGIPELDLSPPRVCPDQTPSESFPGDYWSRFACIV